MPIAPSSDNYTTGAMPTLFFQRTGSSEFNFGCISTASIEPTLEFLDHFCAISGSRTKDKSVVSEKGIQITFNWDEVNVENIRAFMFGSAVTAVGSGTDTATNEEHVLPAGEGLIKLTFSGISSVTVEFRPDVVVHFDDATTTYADFTSVTRTSASGETPAMDETTDFLYVGHSTKFDKITYDLLILGDGSPIGKYEVWTGAAWTDVTTDVSGAGKNLDADGLIDFDDTSTPFGNWAQTTNNFGILGTSASKFWMRISLSTLGTSTDPTFDVVTHLYVDPTDYQVVPLEGYIFAVDSAGTIAGLKVDVDYTYTTVTSSRFDILDLPTIEGQARLAFSPDVGIGFDWFMPKASLKTNGAFEFTDTDWIAPPSLLEVLDDGTGTAPFGFMDIFDV